MATGGKLIRLRKVSGRYSPGRSPREADRDTGSNAPKQGQIESDVPVECGPASEEEEQSQPRDSDVRDTDQDPGTCTSGILNRLREVFRRCLPGRSPGEGDRDTGSKVPKQGQIESDVPMESGPAAEEGEQSQPKDSDVRDTDQDTGTGTKQQKLITTVLRMGQGASSGGVPMTSTSGKDTDPSSVITEILASWNDFQLLQLTDFYRDRLEQAMEGGVHGVSLALTAENQFSGEEHRKISDLADKGERADSSKLLLSLLMEKGSRAPRVMWETFVKMRIGVPKLDKILKEIQEHGCVPVHRPVTEIPNELKDVQQKHKGTLRAQTETLRVNTILMREKVKVFQLVDRYAELTVISTVRDRRLVERELLARGRDHEELRVKYLRRELEKIRTDQLFQSSFCRVKSKSGSSAVVAGAPGIGKTIMVQNIVYDWATGKIYQQFQFVFSFKFRDLNSINGRTNLRELILDQYPYFGNILGELFSNTWRRMRSCTP
ncbi:uncharacterized protein [Hemitrygon akajei]|uniref:uncharacterized protein n=1 Tax=Hemitrygon akajei TaxID=2704970 RepID=UPI003BFA0F22